MIAGTVDRSWAFDEARRQEQLGWVRRPGWGDNRPSSALPLAMPPLGLLLCLGLLLRVPAEPRGTSTTCVSVSTPKACTCGSTWLTYLSLPQSISGSSFFPRLFSYLPP